MKKWLKITGVVILVPALALAVMPFAFKGKILEVAKNELNKSLNAHIDFERLGLNFFRNFPNATVSLENVSVAGIGEFAGDTLISAGELSATVNLCSLFGDAGYEIVKITLDRVRLRAVIRESGKANWDIMPVAAPGEPAGEEADSSPFKLLLTALSITNTNIYYDDIEGNMSVALENLQLSLSGDMTADETRIRTQLRIGALSFMMDKIPYLSRARVNGAMQLDADLKHNIYTLADNHININEISAGIDGWVALRDDGEGIELDIRVQAPETQFKDILSLIPAIYATNFKDLQTAGAVSLQASAKGTMQGDLLPAFDAQLTIADAMFQYPGMPQSVTNIQADIHAFNTGGTADNTVVDISRFHFEMGGNPFDLKLRIGTPVSDPDIALTAVGKLNLGLVKEIYPLEMMELSGRLEANMELAARLSAIEREQYEQVHAAGSLLVSDLLLKSEDMPDMEVKKAALAFSPRYVALSDFAALVGRNDISGSGKIENFIPYFMNDGTLKGTLAVRSEYLNLNDFMRSDTVAVAGDTSSPATLKLPKNITFDMDGSFRRVVFDRLEMDNVVGQLRLKGGKLEMQNLSLDALGGKLKINGYYDSSRDNRPQEVSLALDIRDVSFVKTFETFVTVQQLAPIFENLTGNYSATMQFWSPLADGFMPELGALKADGVLQSSNVTVRNSSVLDGLAAALKNESLKELTIKDLKLPFAIDNGRVTTKPFAVNFGAGVMNLSGTTGLDQSIDYTAHIDLAGKLTNKYLNKVTVKIGGSFTHPTFGIDAKDAADQALGALVGSALGGGAGASVSEQANEELKKQAENIRKQAREAGEKLVAEAEKQGQKLIDEANKTSNALAKIAAVKAAEAAAKKLKDEAQKQADRLNEEAENSIRGLGITD
ncbi:MAG: AsmA family protein [Prevotellaceae bacterium]|nr:AsmA family protein [Prevotellaceae bacterium]